MPQHLPAHDETVRMRADGPDSRPTLEGPRVSPPATSTATSAGQTPVHAQASAQSGAPRAQEPAEDVQFDDTRPVGRDWLSGAPESPATDAGPDDDATRVVAEEPLVDEQRDTQQFDRTTAPVDTLPPPGDDTAAEPPRVLEDSDGDRPDSPGGPPPGDEPPAGDSRGPWWRRKAVVIPAAAVGVLAAAYGADLLISSGEIPRNTVVAGIDIGGMSPADAASTLESDLAPRVVADHTVVAADVEATLSPASAGIELDVDGTVDAAAEQPLNPWTRIVTLFSDRTIEPEITGDETALAAQIETVAAQVDRAPVDATIVLENTTPSLVEPADGRTLDRDGAAEAITDALAAGGDPATPIELPVEVEPVRVDTEEAQRVLDEVVTPALAAPVTVASADGATTAEVPVAAIAAGLTFTPQDDGELAVTIDPAKLQTALGDGLGAFGTPAEDARFEVSGGAVSVVPSVDGTGVDPTLLSEQLAAVGDEEPLGHRRVPAPVARVALRGIGTPKNDQVGPVLDFAQRAGHLADALEGHSRWTMAHRRRRIDATADAVGDGHGDALRLAGGVRKAINDGVFRIDQDSRGEVDRGIEVRRLPLDRRHRPFLDMVIEEPCLAQHAGVLRLGDVVPFDGQLHVVAHTTAKSAGGVRDDFQLGAHTFSISTSIPLLVGMPVPCVSPVISKLDASP
jgi:vancomycin resistance protein YoaR